MKKLALILLLIGAAALPGQITVSGGGAGGGGGTIPSTSDILVGDGAGNASALGSAAGAATFLATPSSANLKTLVTDETGSGGALVFATAPTIAGGAHTALTGLGIRSTGAAFDLTLASSEVLTAGRTLSLNVGDAARTLTLSGNPSLSGITTTGTGTLALGSKTLTASNTLTLAGTDGTTMTFPSTSATVARTDAANTFTGTQTFGAVVGTTWNGNTWATGTGTLSIAASKTLTASNTLTLAGTDGTTMTFPSTSATIARTDAANTFTGVQTFTNPVVGTQAAGNNSTTAASTAYVDGPTNHGGWTEVYVSGSDFTTTNTTATTITGLTTSTLANSTLYEVESVLYLVNAADTTGMKFGWTAGGGGNAAVGAMVGIVTTSADTGAGVGPRVDVLATPVTTTQSGGAGTVHVRGMLTTRSTGTANFSMQIAKVTSNTATVKIGSVLRWRLAGQ